MKLFANFVVNHKKLIIVIFSILFFITFILMLLVPQNYDMSKYLPEDTQSKKGVDILQEEFTYNGQAYAYLDQVTIQEAILMGKQIEQINGVDRVIWLDDYYDLTIPLNQFDQQVVSSYYSNEHALLQIIFIEHDYHDITREAVLIIEELLSENDGLSGSAIDATNTVDSIGANILWGIIIAVIIIIAILIAFTHSVFEVVLFLIITGVSIVMNMGTNIIFGEISYITFTSASILQLAISMDYSIFLLHRFAEEKTKTDDVKLAMRRAISGSIKAIFSSASTTIAGFLALIFMSYTIGMDMGLVLAKGILLSLISVLALLPVLALISTKMIDKSSHRVLLPSFKKMQQKLGGRLKILLLILVLLITFVSYLAQSQNDFDFYSKTGDNEEQLYINQQISEVFGFPNQVILLLPKGEMTNEVSLVNNLVNMDGIASIQGYYTLIDPTIPDELIPEFIKVEFLSENYSRYIINITGEIESDETFIQLEKIEELVISYYDEYYLTGNSKVVMDMKQVTTEDFKVVNLLSILGVGLIILIAFKSISIPLILLLVIESSIFINMSIPYYSGQSMMFIGYMIVSAVQLGATIDYAILLTSYYQEGRKTLSPKKAAVYAVERSGHSIFTSAVVLGAAGLTISFIFTQPELSQLGILIGRGALISLAMVLLILPQLLSMLDKFINKTTLKGAKKNEKQIS